MDITYDWIINKLISEPQVGSLTNVVKEIHYAYTAFEPVGNDFAQATVYGILKCESPDQNSFVNYSDLAESQVIGWLESSLDMQSLKEEADTLLELRKSEINSKLRIPF